MFTRANWRLLLGEFVVIVVGVLFALWVDQLAQDRLELDLEIDYLRSLITDLDADLVQFDSTEAWMRRSESAAATVLALYAGSPPTDDETELVAAVETAGWQYVPSITRNTIDDLRSTGNLRLIRDPGIRRAISVYYLTVDNVSIPLADIRNRLWAQYDARVANVLQPAERLGVLQSWSGSFGQGTTSSALLAVDPPSAAELIEALQGFPELETAAGEVLYQTINSRAGLESMRQAAQELRTTLAQWLEVSL